MNIGDKVYFDFEEGVIDNIRDGKIKSVSFEYTSTGSYDMTDRCFPANNHTKYISDRIRSYYEMILDARGVMNLNIPDIHKTYVEYWLQALKENTEENLAQAGMFTKLILNKIDELKKEEIFGIRILR